MDKRIENLTRKCMKSTEMCDYVRKLLLECLEKDDSKGIEAIARGNVGWLSANNFINQVSKLIDLGNGRFKRTYGDGLIVTCGNIVDFHDTISVSNKFSMIFVTLFNKYGNGLATKQISKTSDEWWFRYWIDCDADVLYHYRDGVTQIKHNYFADWHDSIGGTGSVDGEYPTPLDNYQELLEMPYDELQKFISSIPHPSKMPLPANWEVLPRRTTWIRI